MPQDGIADADKPPFEDEGEEWETVADGVKRRIIPSDMPIRFVPEDPTEAQQRLMQEQIDALPDEAWAHFVLKSIGSKNLDRADTLARARAFLRGYPQFTEYNSPLEWAISRDTTELLEGVLNGTRSDGGDSKSEKFDPNTVSSCQTALYHAVSDNKIHNVRLLLDHGADPNAYSLYENFNEDDPWQVPLHCAARQWQFDSIKLLLERGADKNALSLLNGQTALHHALLAARFWASDPNWPALEPTIRCLTHAGADVNIRDENMHAPLDIWLGLDDGHEKVDAHQITKLILEAGADINATGILGNSSFMIAAALEGPSNLFRTLLECGKPSVNQQNDEGETALHLLAQRGALEDVILLLEAGANPNIQSKNGETPLHRAACRRGFHEIVRSLLANTDPAIPREDGKTAIDLAMMAGEIKETMEVFMTHGPSLALIEAAGASRKAEPDTLLSRFDKPKVGSSTSPSPGCGWPSNTENKNSLSSEGVTISSSKSTVSPNLETLAFAKSVQSFENLHYRTLPSGTVRIVPKRLVDITTGDVVSGDNSMKYVIGSYLWSPEETPGLPRDIRAYERISETWQRVLEACQKFPDLIEVIHSEQEKTSMLKYPAKSAYPREPNPAYLSEVYQLLAREAHRRGLHFVWIDSFCINQADETDKSEQIPLMADYYRNAECCVVVSETLRRHIRPEFDPSREFFDSGDSVTDRILAWAIGFHFNRVWVLQETRLAKEVVTRSGSVRIRTTEVLSSNFAKDSPDANKLWRHPVRKWEPANKTQSSIGKAIQKLPLAGSRIDGDQPISVDFCMMLLRDRSSRYRHDGIFGILGLFPESVRKSVPIDYTLSLSTVFAIFIYLRIRSGDPIGLLSVRAPDQPPHHIQDAPSWLPSGYGFNYADILDFQPEPALNLRTEAEGRLYLRMSFIRIADCYWLDDNVFGVDQYADHGNILLHLMGENKTLLPGIRRAAVEPVDPNYGLTSDDSFGTNHTYVMRPPIMPTQLSGSDMLKVAEERERRRLQIQIAARQDRAVVAMLGTEGKGMNNDLVLITVWLILVSDDDGRTWRRHGIMRVQGAKDEGSLGSEGTEMKEFCIV